MLQIETQLLVYKWGHGGSQGPVAAEPGDPGLPQPMLGALPMPRAANQSTAKHGWIDLE